MLFRSGVVYVARVLQPSILGRTPSRIALAWPLNGRCVFGGLCLYGGCTRPALDAPGLGSQGRERAFNMHTFPPNTHTCLILVLMMVYSKCSTVSTTCSYKSLFACDQTIPLAHD